MTTVARAQQGDGLGDVRSDRTRREPEGRGNLLRITPLVHQPQAFALTRTQPIQTGHHLANPFISVSLLPCAISGRALEAGGRGALTNLRIVVPDLIRSSPGCQRECPVCTVRCDISVAVREDAWRRVTELLWPADPAERHAVGRSAAIEAAIARWEDARRVAELAQTCLLPKDLD